MNIKYKITIFA